MSEKLPDFPSLPVTETVLGVFQIQDEDRVREWNRILDFKLQEWSGSPSIFDPDEIVPPTQDAIKAAYVLAKRMRDVGFDGPDWVEPSGNGGIAFRWGIPGQHLRSLEIDDAGTAEMVLTEHCRETNRIRITE